MTRAWRSHHVWQLRRLDLKGRICECVMHVSSAGTSLVEGHSCLSISLRGSMSFFSHVFCSCRVFFVVICSYDETCVDSGGCRLILIILFQRQGVSVVLFVVHHLVWGHVTWRDSWRERHIQHARRRKKRCQRRGVGMAAVRCSERRWSHLSAYDEQIGRANLQPFGQFQTDVHADAQNVVCTMSGRCSEVLIHLFRAGTGQQDNTRPPLNVFGADGEDSRLSDLRRGSMKHSCSQATHTELQSHGSKQCRSNWRVWKHRFDGRNTRGFLTIMQACAQCACVTRAWRSHHVWQLRRLEFKGAFVDVRDACEQFGNVC